MRGFRHVAKRTDADAALHIGEQAADASPCASPSAPAAPLAPADLRPRRPLAPCAAPAGFGGELQRRRRRCGGLRVSRFRLCRAPTENSPRWQAQGTTRCSLRTSRHTFGQAQTDFAGYESAASGPRFRATARRPHPLRAPCRQPRDLRREPARGGRASASSPDQASRKGANPSRSNCTSILKSSSKSAPANPLRETSAGQASATAAARTPASLELAPRRGRQGDVEADADDHVRRPARIRPAVRSALRRSCGRRTRCRSAI